MDQKIGTIVDLLIDKDGQVRAAMLTVGGFLGLPSKHVSTPFMGLQVIPKERKPHIVLDIDKRALREARDDRGARSRLSALPSPSQVFYCCSRSI